MDIQKIAAHWDACLYDQEETQTDDVSLLLSTLGKKPLRVLEACCGSGRILVPLAKAGHNVTGFDLNAEMLARIPAKAQGLSNLRTYQADLFHHDWDSGYDVVVLAGNILINIITDGDYAQAQQLMIQKAASAVRPGGYLYLDFQHTAHPEEIFSRTEERVIFEGTDDTGVHGRYLIYDGHYDSATQMAVNRRRTELTLPTGEHFEIPGTSSKHIPTLKQVYQWLSKAGCTVREAYGSYDCSPIGEDTRRAILYAQKR